jgi:DNA-binding FadR family transcriptional regulator
VSVLRLERVDRLPHLPALVAGSIAREIAEGRLKPGDRLPTEQALSATFDVSRNVVREAVARLRSEGLVWAQQGRGAFVADNPKPLVLKIDVAALGDPAVFADMFELRLMLETQAAALAAERRRPEQLAALEALLATMLGALYGSVAWIDADLEFHRGIARATSNTYVVDVIGFVAGRMRESILRCAGERAEDHAQVTLAEHRAILTAVAQGDAQAAAAAMRGHLMAARERLGLEPGAPG